MAATVAIKLVALHRANEGSDFGLDSYLCHGFGRTHNHNLQILFNLYSIEYAEETRYLMLKLFNFIVFVQYLLSLKLMRHVSKKLRQGQQQTGKVDKCWKKHLFGSFHKWMGSLETGECHDWVYKEHPQKAQTFTSKDGARITTCWTTAWKKLSYSVRTMFLNIQMQGIKGLHHQQSII